MPLSRALSTISLCYNLTVQHHILNNIISRWLSLCLHEQKNIKRRRKTIQECSDSWASLSSANWEAVPHLDQVGANCCYKWCVVLNHRWKTHSQLDLAESSSLEHHIRFLTPGNKEAVVFHPCHHVIYLLHRIPGESRMERKAFLAPSTELHVRK